jgi:hypothetical protein
LIKTAKEVMNIPKNYFSSILKILMMAVRKPPICEIRLVRVTEVTSVTLIVFWFEKLSLVVL